MTVLTALALALLLAVRRVSRRIVTTGTHADGTSNGAGAGAVQRGT